MVDTASAGEQSVNIKLANTTMGQHTVEDVHPTTDLNSMLSA